MPDLNGKTALVTGAGRGIGLGCALELARAGATIILNDRPNSPDIANAAEQIRACGGTCLPIESDVFSRAGCESLLKSAVDQADHIDVLVSNPAWNTRCGFLDQDPDEFEHVIRTTFMAGFHMSQLVSRHMVERGAGGSMLFISSVQAEMPMVGNIGYGPAKAALNHMTRSIAVELAEHRIRVNAIEPGWIETPGEHEAFGTEMIRAEAAKLPLGRLGTPADIGKAAAYLCSDDADYVTGTIMVVDGGFRYKDCRAGAVITPPHNLTSKLV